ncbi:hypothetical protein J7E70_23490 [Variovorax paradoxus]|nr:hypothetical protein [Variovorax paradoxus]MBT2303418.1 hypothetical protein [Variovorax paradoxus]
MSRADPIRSNYYDSVELFEKLSDFLFYVAAVLSLVSLFVDKTTPRLYEVTLTAFALAVIALFGCGLFLRLYLTPRAEDNRRKDYFSKAFGVNLTHDQTDGYYNNAETDPIRRLGAQLLENSHFSKAITRRMARFERWRATIYVAVYLICVFNRQADIGIVLAASQAVFSEQILSKWLRLEWLRTRCEATYESTYRLFAGPPPKSEFAAMTLESMAMYETTKSSAGITLSSKYFGEMNDALSAEWDAVKTAINL